MSESEEIAMLREVMPKKDKAIADMKDDRARLEEKNTRLERELAEEARLRVKDCEDRNAQKRRADIAVAANTPLVARVAALEQLLSDGKESFERLLKAADDLCFQCDGVVATRAPDRNIYNAAFDIIRKSKANLQTVWAVTGTTSDKASFRNPHPYEGLGDGGPCWTCCEAEKHPDHASDSPQGFRQPEGHAKVINDLRSKLEGMARSRDKWRQKYEAFTQAAGMKPLRAAHTVLIDVVRQALHTLQDPMRGFVKRCLSDLPHDHKDLQTVREAMRLLQEAHDAAVAAQAPTRTASENPQRFRQPDEAHDASTHEACDPEECDFAALVQRVFPAQAFERPECPFNFCDQENGGICKEKGRCRHRPGGGSDV